MTQRIWWVRHGPTHRKDMVGWTDAPADLSDHAALERLAAYLPQVPVVSSDLIRARATADAIQHSRPRLADERDVREIHFGAWEARRAKDLYDEDPKTLDAFWSDPTHIRPPGGESFGDVAARVEVAVDRLLATQPELIVVAHFGVILTQIHRARGGEMAKVLSQRVENLSVTCLRRDADGWHEEVVNHTA